MLEQGVIFELKEWIYMHYILTQEQDVICELKV